MADTLTYALGFLTAGLSLAVAGCAQFPRWETARNGVDEAIRCESEVVVSRQSEQIRYRGDLTAQGLWAVRRLSQGRPISTLVISSSGGEINLGMDFGDWVFERGASVVVDEFCLSSCANYVFTAGWHKTILPRALVAWHGSARQKDLPDQLARVVDDQVKALALAGDGQQRERDKRIREVTDYLTKSIARQDAFFDKVGVSEYVTRVGSERYGIKGFYFMSSHDMARFGIQNLVVPAEYEETDASGFERKLNVPVTRLRLANDDAP